MIDSSSGCESLTGRKKSSISGPKTAKKRVSLMPWGGWQPCFPMSWTRGSRWSGIMDITVMSAGAIGKTKSVWMDTLYPGIRRITKRAPEELGQSDSEDLRIGPPDLPEIFRKDESHQRDWGYVWWRPDYFIPDIILLCCHFNYVVWFNSHLIPFP